MWSKQIYGVNRIGATLEKENSDLSWQFYRLMKRQQKSALIDYKKIFFHNKLSFRGGIARWSFHVSTLIIFLRR